MTSRPRRSSLAPSSRGAWRASSQRRWSCAWPKQPRPTAMRRQREAIERALRRRPALSRPRLYPHLGGGGPSAGLAAALESTAEHLPSDSAKARHYLMSAEVFARAVGDTQGAKLALSQAGLSGAPPPLVGRLARLLAALTSDAAWYEEATRRLMAQGANDSEYPGLVELGRARGLRGDRTAPAAFQSIARTGRCVSRRRAHQMRLAVDRVSVAAMTRRAGRRHRGDRPMANVLRPKSEPSRALHGRRRARRRCRRRAELRSSTERLHVAEPATWGGPAIVKHQRRPATSILPAPPAGDERARSRRRQLIVGCALARSAAALPQR